MTKNDNSVRIFLVHPERFQRETHFRKSAEKRRSKKREEKDCARRGASGALLPTIRYSGVEFPAEAVLCLASVRVSGVEGLGSVQRALCELRQDREVAAVAELPLVLQVNLA